MAKLMQAADEIDARAPQLRRVDPQHARRHLLSLTPEGVANFELVLKQARPFQAALLNALTQQEREALSQIMAKLMQAADEIDARAPQLRRAAFE